MRTIEVQVQADHLQRLADTTPLTALLELIWNALDAEADLVQVTFETADMGAINRIVVNDDGHGMPFDEALDSFSRLGGSWKSRADRSKRARRLLHGREGKGRFRAFRLGSEVRWESVWEDGEGERYRIRIRGHHGNLRQFDISEPEPTVDETGTTVRIIAHQQLDDLLGEEARDFLTAKLAPYMTRYPDVEIVLAGDTLDPSDLQQVVAEYPMTVDVGTQRYEAVLRIIEWSRDLGQRVLVLCDGAGFALSEIRHGIQAPGFEFTAYLMTDRFRDLVGSIALGELHPEIEPFVVAARDQMKQHFRQRRREQGHEVIEEWKQSGVYPYPDTATNPVEEAEREVFDVLALQVNEHAAGFSRSSDENKRLTMRLLKEALETRPAALRTIMQELLQLPEEQQEDLVDLLSKTSLSSIIRASKVIVDRLDFLSALEIMLFEPEHRDRLLERSQLHRVLVDEAWVFGEQWHLSVDDGSLTRALEAHIELMRRDKLARAVDPEVLTTDGKRGILDLMFSTVATTNHGRREHLVVELKRPSTKLGQSEINQIKEYAYAVVEDPRFDRTETRWDFWLVGNELDRFAKNEAVALGAELDREGLLVNRENFRVWIRPWSQVIDDCRSRLHFYQQQLEYASTEENALGYLRATHAKYLPEMLEGDQPEIGTTDDSQRASGGVQ